MEHSNRIAYIIRHKGYKLTPQRLAVLKVVSLSHERLTPADIYKMVHQEYPNIGLVTVYRTLEILNDLGLICEMHTADGHRSYLLKRPSGHHHHLVCTDCGTVVDFADCGLGKLEKKLSEKTGFKIDSHTLELSGHCKECQKTATSGES